MHKLQVLQIFAETPPPPSMAGEDMVTSALDEIHVDSWLPFFSAFLSISFGTLIYCWIYRGLIVFYVSF